MKFRFIPWLLLSCLVFSVALAHSKDLSEDSQFNFECDYNTFRVENGQSYIEIYCQIPFYNINFREDASGAFISPQQVEITLKNANGIVREDILIDTVRVKNFLATRSRFDALSYLRSYFIDPGMYECELVTIDLLSGARVKRTMPVEIRSFDQQKLQISDVQLATRIHSENEKSVFHKNGVFVQPNPSRQYNLLVSHLPVYYEIYNIPKSNESKGEALTISFLVSDAHGRVLKKLHTKSLFQATSCVQSALVPVRELEVGSYKITVEVVHQATGAKTVASQFFEIGKETTKDNQLAIEMMQQLQYVASESEFQQLQFLFSRRKRLALIEFWSMKDPTPETVKNELMEEFYRRIDFVNRRFTNRNMRGWQTEAGRIYVTLGPPDAVKHSQFQNSENICEIWIYEKLKRRYIFTANNEVIKIRT